jgi:hypothetical protein
LTAEANEADIDAALAEFGGDARAAIGALLHDIGVLATDTQAVISKGCRRVRQRAAARGRAGLCLGKDLPNGSRLAAHGWLWRSYRSGEIRRRLIRLREWIGTTAATHRQVGGRETLGF